MEKIKKILLFSVMAVVLCCGCGAAQEIKAVKGNSLFGASPEEASKLLGIRLVKQEKEEDTNQQYCSVYTSDGNYTINGNPFSLRLYFKDQKTPAGNSLGLITARFLFTKDCDFEELKEYLQKQYKLESPYSNQSETKERIGWQGEYYTDWEEERKNKFETVYETIEGAPGLIPIWNLELIKSKEKIELDLICRGAAIARYLDDYPSEQ